MSFNAIRENNILAKIPEFTVHVPHVFESSGSHNLGEAYTVKFVEGNTKRGGS